ncbi:MAG: hypothetical protein ACI9EF_000219 [Pseudohongiellaceae bacterium]|jgi:hypothetical protein
MFTALRTLSALTVAAAFAVPASAQFDIISAAQLADRESFIEALDVGDFTIQTVNLPPAQTGAVTVQLSLDGQLNTLNLHRWSVRSEEHFEVLKQVADGSYVEVDAGESKIWRGVVAEVPGSRVSASIIDGQLEALIYLHDDQPLWGVQPARSVSPSYGSNDYVVYNSSNNIDRGLTCGGAIPVAGTVSPPPSGGSFSGIGDDVICEIACDADVEFYNKNGSSVSNTEADIENIIDRVENIYQPDSNILYEITTIIVRTAEPDPYGSTNPGTLLGQFQNHWTNNQQAVQRDIAHLFTGKNIQGGVIGIAFLGVICSSGQGYGLSESRFTSNITFRTALTAHELGHNWSAGHCDGQGDCKIMCSGLGGCGSVTSFGNSAKNSINNEKNSANCLDDALPPPPPTITAFNPSTSNALGSQITVTGTSLLKVTALTVNGVVVSGSDVITQTNTTLIFNAPSATALGPVNVTATNPGGTSSPLALTYVAANPPVFQSPSTINTFADTQAVWTFASSPGDVNYFLLGFNNNQFIYKGFSVLNTMIPVLAIPSNAAGVGTIIVPINPTFGGMGFYNIFTQVAHFNPVIYAVSPVKSTLVF